jgi:SPP1 family predicted phage head-tail adaptor
MPFLGSFNRRVVMETKFVIQDPTGFPVETWLPARTMWANRKDITASERFRSAQELATRTSRFTIRWFRDLTAGDWRIRHEDMIWDIEGIAEPPNTRRQYWELTASASETSTPGAASDTTAPTVPTNLAAAAVSNTAINLSWTASTDAIGVTGYNIYRDGLLIDSSTTTSYADTGLTDATLYSYQVTAFDAAGNESALSVADTATTGYVANPVNFDGTNDYLIRGAGLTGAADSKLWTGSVWLRRASVGTTERIFYSSGASCSVHFTSTNTISIMGENSAGSVILILNSLVAITDTNWHHLMWSVDTSDVDKRHLRIDDVSSVSPTYSNAAIDFTVANFAIGAQDGGAQKYTGDIADLQVWFGKYVDLALQANRELFITAAGDPVDPSIAAASALGAPIVLMNGATSTWHTNDGTGGGFTLNGLLTDGTPI